MTRVQTLLVSHCNHRGTEVTFTFAVDEATRYRSRAIGVTGREFAYECNP